MTSTTNRLAELDAKASDPALESDLRKGFAGLAAEMRATIASDYTKAATAAASRAAAAPLSKSRRDELLGEAEVFRARAREERDPSTAAGYREREAALRGAVAVNDAVAAGRVGRGGPTDEESPTDEVLKRARLVAQPPAPFRSHHVAFSGSALRAPRR